MRIECVMNYGGVKPERSLKIVANENFDPVVEWLRALGLRFDYNKSCRTINILPPRPDSGGGE